MNRTNETGRSMVEMLGVLAVMGVLSVGGVTMYTSAMNKHRANELLNEASKRATSIAAQISMMGKDPDTMSVSEFGNPSGYVFTVAKKNPNQFTIGLKTEDNGIIDSEICTQMKAAVGTATPIRKISDDCAELTFNNDLSKNSSSDQENSLTETPSADCTGKEDGTLCDTPFDTLYWGYCYNEICLSWQPSCKWTEWFNVDTPPEGSFNDSNGDFETIENIRAAGGEVCDHPQEIECEALKYPGLTVKQVGQNAVCDPESGLICINSEQPGLFKHCYDYHVRFLCCEYKDGRVRRSPIS